MPDESPARSDPADPGVRHRNLRDPRALRAVAHPVRLALMEQLGLHGPSTATELADRLQDQSPANCSWHLRQLAQYGFIEEAGSGPGRQRRWRLVVESTSVDDDNATPELTRAADAFDNQLIERALAIRQAWKQSRLSEPKRWRDASYSCHSWAWMTADEAAAFGADLQEVVARHVYPTLERFEPDNRPPGTRPVQLISWLVPAGQEVPDKPATGTDDSDDVEESR